MSHVSHDPKIFVDDGRNIERTSSWNCRKTTTFKPILVSQNILTIINSFLQQPTPIIIMSSSTDTNNTTLPAYPTAYSNSVGTTPADGHATYIEKIQKEGEKQAKDERVAEMDASTGGPGLPTENKETLAVNLDVNYDTKN